MADPANPILGEVEVQTLGRTFTFVLDFRALARLDEKNPGMIGAELDVMRPFVVEQCWVFGLERHHGDVGPDLVNDIVSDIGLTRAREIIVQSALTGYARGSDVRPRKAARAKSGTSAPN